MANTSFKWRKWNNILHRDIGYLAFGLTLIYSISGIALNHMRDWNPNYSISHQEVQWEGGVPAGKVPSAAVKSFLATFGEEDGYKSHYRPDSEVFKVFVHSGNVVLNSSSGKGYLEKIERRPMFYEFNFLHYNPRVLWTWFSDIFCGALIIVAISGLFVLKGRKGITGRGAWLTAIGVIIPALFLIAYL